MPEALLSPEQIATFLRDGVLVVEHMLSEDELITAQQGLADTLAAHGVDCEDLTTTGQALGHLSSTHGSGGVLDLFYDQWKLEVATHPNLFHCTTQLWKEAYCHKGEGLDDLPDPLFKWHPNGAFDPNRGYAYVDRIGYRIPTSLAQTLGHKKNKPLQRSLTPHLDCCPETYLDTSIKSSKWRPIQCFVSLTENMEPSTGGFEAAKGFHLEFANWNRPPTVRANGLSTIPAPCFGEYTHIRPKEDADVFQRIQHIAVPAGSAVFWDNRIPHANAYTHTGLIPRAVVYCSFLPADIAINQSYAVKQLENWRHGRQPTDQWIQKDASTENKNGLTKEQEEQLSPLQRRLLAIDPWE
jgi:hypothetical protein